MKKWQIISRSLLAAGCLVGMMIGSTTLAKERPAHERADGLSLKKTGGAYEPERYQVLNINNLWSWHRRDGQSNHSPSGDNGTFFPRGTSFVIYQDGMVFGSKAYLDENRTMPAPYSQTIRVGGATYGTGQREGWIDGFGASAVARTPDDPRTRIYRIRRDWQEMSDAELRRDAAESNETSISSVTDGMVQQIVDDYAFCWNNWPVDLGAPYIDRNGNGTYDPPPAGFSVADLIANQYDEPGIAGADPDSPADQVLWAVFNDLNRETSVGRFGSEPTGLEIQMTMWGYKRQDALGNMLFRKWRFINKGGVEIDQAGTKGAFYLDSMYVCQWSDPDLGSFSDDLVGVDTDLGVGFVYNGNAIDTDFRKFNLPPPSAGYDFLQGPIVEAPGEQAVFDLKVKNDFRNLGLTGFSYFSAGSPYSDPGGGYDTNTIQWYKMLRGFAPLDGPDVRYAHPPGVEEGPFPLAGDPVAGIGHIDGQGEDYSFVPGDRRLLVITGPFSLAPGDTQEVVVSLVAGIGSDRLSSVSVMKFNDRFAQNTYDALFQVPSAPASPRVNVSEFDGKATVEWGSDIERVRLIEDKVNEPGGYRFEGYNIYQLPSPTSSLSDGVRIATFDTKADPAVVLDEAFDVRSGQILEQAVQFGSNVGVQRYFTLDRDYIADKDGLNNGQEYYFAVTSYSVATVPGFLPASLESEVQVLAVVAQQPGLGERFTAEFDQAIPVEQTSGSGSATVEAAVLDPASIQNATYTIQFADAPAGSDAYRTWSLSRGGTVLYDKQSNYALDNNYLVADGVITRLGGLVFDPPTTYLDASQTVDPTGGGALTLWGDGTLFGNSTGYWQEFGNGQAPPSVDLLQADLEFRFTGMTGAGDSNNDAPIASGGQWATQWPRGSFGAPDLSATPSVQVRLPFELWDVENNQQIQVAVINRNADGASPYGNDIGTAADARWRITGRDYIIPVHKPYNEATAATDVVAHTDPLATWLLFFNQGGAAVWNNGDVMKVEFANPIQPGVDVFSYSTTGLAKTVDPELAKADAAEKVGVFPNPYYAFNPLETNRLSRFVTFNNLPQKATVRIFNLGGQLVNTIEKDSGSKFLQWNLLNMSNLPVASGMYIAHIEMPDVGVTKILKVAIVQEAEVLDTF